MINRRVSMSLQGAKKAPCCLWRCGSRCTTLSLRGYWLFWGTKVRCARWHEDGRLQMGNGKPEVLPDPPPELPTGQDSLSGCDTWLKEARDEMPVEQLGLITPQSRPDLRCPT